MLSKAAFRTSFVRLPARVASAGALRPSVPVRRMATQFRGNSSHAVSEAGAAGSQATSGSGLGSKLVIGGSAAGVLALVGVNLVGAQSATSALDESQVWSDETRSRVRSTYGYIGGGLAFTAVAARAAYSSRTLAQFCARSPIMSSFVFLGGSIVCMLGAQSVPVENSFAKHACLLGFQSFIGMSLAPLGVVAGPVLIRAALATAATVGSLSAVAMTAPSDAFLYMGGPLAIGLGAVFAASVATLFFPASGLLQNVTVYGGGMLFGAFVLYDTQRTIHAAKFAEQYDPISASMSVYLDTINIFVRMVAIMNGGGSKRR